MKFKLLIESIFGNRGKSCRFCSQSGAALVEALIAVSVAIIVVSALVSLSVFSLRNSKESSYTAYATNLAEAQLEYARAYRDNATVTWNAFVTAALTTGGGCAAPTSPLVAAGKCYFSAPSTQTNPPTITRGSLGTDGIFRYATGFTCASAPCNATSGIVRASVTVEWSVSGKTYTV